MTDGEMNKVAGHRAAFAAAVTRVRVAKAEMKKIKEEMEEEMKGIIIRAAARRRRPEGSNAVPQEAEELVELLDDLSLKLDDLSQKTAFRHALGTFSEHIFGTHFPDTRSSLGQFFPAQGAGWLYMYIIPLIEVKVEVWISNLHNTRRTDALRASFKAKLLNTGRTDELPWSSQGRLKYLRRPRESGRENYWTQRQTTRVQDCEKVPAPQVDLGQCQLKEGRGYVPRSETETENRDLVYCVQADIGAESSVREACNVLGMWDAGHSWEAGDWHSYLGLGLGPDRRKPNSNCSIGPRDCVVVPEDAVPKIRGWVEGSIRHDGDLLTQICFTGLLVNEIRDEVRKATLQSLGQEFVTSLRSRTASLSRRRQEPTVSLQNSQLNVSVHLRRSDGDDPTLLLLKNVTQCPPSYLFSESQSA